MEKSEMHTGIAETLNKLMFDHYYSLSIESARKGDYTLANKYISDMSNMHGTTPLLLDLQAKIYAQQGNLEAAESLWKKCAAHDPDNGRYSAALNKIKKLQKKKVSWLFRLIKLIGAVLFFAVLSFLFVSFFQGNDEKITALELWQKKQSALLERMDKKLANTEKNPTANMTTLISEKITEVNGVTVEKDNGELFVTFNEGLFRKGIRFNATHKAVVMQLLKVLDGFSGDLMITVLGCSDNIPIADSKKYKSNHALGLARANYIYDIFYQNSRIPSESLALGSIGDTDPPFPNDTAENRLKNRTVVIKIIQKK